VLGGAVEGVGEGSDFIVFLCSPWRRGPSSFLEEQIFEFHNHSFVMQLESDESSAELLTVQFIGEFG
jgi:hypothetical protein